MKYLFDSSILIASFIQGHPKHDLAFSWLKKAKNKEFTLYVSAHSLLEIYSALTGAPFNPKILPLTAKRMIDENIKKFAEIVILNKIEYYGIIEDMIERKYQGGVIYDALIMKCAYKSKVDHLVTLNTQDFIRLQDINKPIDIIGF